jgi:hypothetical protein
MTSSESARPGAGKESEAASYTVCQRGAYARRAAVETGREASGPGSMVVWVRARAERIAAWASMAVRWRKQRPPNRRGRAIWAATGPAASQGRWIRENTAARSWGPSHLFLYIASHMHMPRGVRNFESVQPWPHCLRAAIMLIRRLTCRRQCGCDAGMCAAVE